MARSKQCIVAVFLALFIIIVLFALTLVGFLRDYRRSERVKLTKKEQISAVNQAVKTILNCNPWLPGFTVGIVKDGKTVLTRGYGLADIYTKNQVNTHTVFGIASISKSFTALLALQILAEHNRSRSTKVKDILGPDFRFSNDFLTKYTTTGDLISHRTGLPPVNYLRFDNNFNRDALSKVMAKVKPVEEFRDSFIYSNIGYGLLAHVTEVLANIDWSILIKERIFDKLKMQRTFLRNTVEHYSDISTGYFYKNKHDIRKISNVISRFWGEIGGSGSVMTTADDMIKWMSVLLNKGVTDDGIRVFDEKIVEEAFVPRTVAPKFSSRGKPTYPEMFTQNTYASGLITGSYRGYSHIYHSGFTYGYCAMMILIPDQKLGIFIATNGRDSSRKARLPLMFYLLDTMLGYLPWLDQSTLCSYPEPWKPQKAETQRNESVYEAKRNLSTYTGTYGIDTYKRNITVKLGNKYLHFNYGYLTGILVPEQKIDHFTLKGTGLTWFFYGSGVHFSVFGNNAKAESVTVPRFDTKYPPTFFRIE